MLLQISENTFSGNHKLHGEEMLNHLEDLKRYIDNCFDKFITEANKCFEVL